MSRPVIFIVIAILVFVTLIYVMVSAPRPTQFSPAETQQETLETKTIEPDFVVPQNLTNCSKAIFENDDKGRPKFDCDLLDRNLVCAYYKKVFSGQEMIIRSEFTNDCYLCKFFGLTGKKQFQSTSYELLGYSFGRCIK